MSEKLTREEIRRRVRLRSGQADNVPGPTDNPSTNLLFADIVMRMGSYVLRNGVERVFLKERYGKDTAKEIMHNRSIARTLASIAIAKVGARSLPGAAVVGGGILARVLYDRSKSRRQAQAEGDSDLIERAETPVNRPDT